MSNDKSTLSRESVTDCYVITSPIPETWAKEPTFLNKVIKKRQIEISGRIASLSLQALVEIVTEREPFADEYGRKPYTYPAAVRAKIALELLRLGGHSEAYAAHIADSDRQAALHELTEEQLAAHVAEASRLLATLQDKPSAPAVAPDPPDIASLL
jgi:hypothetical protein